LLELRQALHRPAALQSLGYPDGGIYFTRDVPPARELLWRYLTDPGVFGQGRVVEWVDLAGEAEALERLQTDVRREVDRRGVSVETNPSSNLLIGDLGDMARHPLWHLAPPVPAPGIMPVPVCFGSDDPITFATTIRHEYQLVLDTLISAGIPAEDALRWLDRVRANGLRARFTVPAARG
jgi:hypothetical protein